MPKSISRRAVVALDDIAHATGLARTIERELVGSAGAYAVFENGRLQELCEVGSETNVVGEKFRERVDGKVLLVEGEFKGCFCLVFVLQNCVHAVFY